MSGKNEAYENTQGVVVTKDQHAIVIERNGDISTYIAIPEGVDENEAIDAGAMELLRVTVFLGDTPFGQMLRTMAQNHIDTKMRLMKGEEAA